jgi:histidyl-tRNA synthetase
MKKNAAISGFPEWLPAQKMIEQEYIRKIREQFELFGFAPIETRAVEPLTHLLKKGETDKEIYLLRRLQAEEGAGDSELGLHFDLTVPLARYVAQNQSDLQFPFKRYQIQKVWRGERPQEGRYREFYQADIDVIGQGNLPLYFDGEMPILLHAVMSSLPIPPVTIMVNNRKLMEGFYRGLGIEDIQTVLRIVDKLSKIGPAEVKSQLMKAVEVPESVAEKCLELAKIQRPDASFEADVRGLGVEHPLLDEGIAELSFVMKMLERLPKGAAVANLSIARGLDYYTGTVYEGILEGHESLGSVCSGGRYDNLIEGGRHTYPGVGVSIGLTRILVPFFAKGLLPSVRNTPTCVLVALVSEEGREKSMEVAESLRSRGIAAEVYHLPQKFGKQIRYAERKGIPFVWFPGMESNQEHEVRDIRSGEQTTAEAAHWNPPEVDKLSVGLMGE